MSNAFPQIHVLARAPTSINKIRAEMADGIVAYYDNDLNNLVLCRFLNENNIIQILSHEILHWVLCENVGEQESLGLDKRYVPVVRQYGLEHPEQPLMKLDLLLSEMGDKWI